MRLSSYGLVLAMVAASACQPEREPKPDPQEKDAPVARVRSDTAVQRLARQPRPEPTVITCTFPVSAADDVASLRARFKQDARIERLPGPEGTTLGGVALWADDPARRVEVLFGDEEVPVGKATGVRIASGSSWRIAGLKAGASLAEVVAANGKPVQFFGFEWDYGGFVTDRRGGRLDALPGGCALSLRLSPGEGIAIPDKFSGEGEIASDDPGLAMLQVRVSELTLSFPEPRREK